MIFSATHAQESNQGKRIHAFPPLHPSAIAAIGLLDTHRAVVAHLTDSQAILCSQADFCRQRPRG